MKSTVIAFILFFMVQICQATKDTILPEEPWRAIVFMEKYNPDVCWKNDISIKLFGNYSSADSLMIEKSIETLNELSETVKLSLTTQERGNFEIFFLDSANEKTFESIISHGKEDISYTSFYQYYEQKNGVWAAKSIRHYILSLRLSMVPDDLCQNYLTSSLAYAMYPKTLNAEYLFKSGRKFIQNPIAFLIKSRTREMWTMNGRLNTNLHSIRR